jgi:beta-glucosidase
MPDLNALISQLTLEEKAALCTGASAWTTVPVDRLGVPAIIVSDGPHGVRRVADLDGGVNQSLPATCFPTASCLAATWSVDLLYAMGQALADECLARNVDVLLGPGANMKRTPLGGRNFEYFSEDPFLAGQMAASLINGVQSKGVGTSLKHFAVNNQEFQRFSINAQVDERTLREIYLPAFEMAVKQAQPWTVMCAYNKVNGTFCSEHHELLVDILKTEWGFEGAVVSDWGAVHDRVVSLQGGLDLEMPGPKDERVKAVVEAVQAGTLDEAVLDEAVRRVLGVVFKAAQTPKGGQLDVDAHHALARQIAAEGMVLLKNDGILPLQNPQRVTVIGHAAKEAHFQGGGSSHINPTRTDVPYEALERVAGGAALSYAEGYSADGSLQPALIEQAVAAARLAEVALVFLALPASKESEGYDRPDLDVTPQQAALIKAVASAQPKTVIILNNGAPLGLSGWIGDVAAVLEGWMMGQAGAGAIADILYGRVNPSGKLAETFPLKLNDTPAFINYPGELGEVRYGEGLFMGYRYYDAKAMPVQFPFGYGGSYTTFAYGAPTVSATTFRDIDGLSVSVAVTNTGPVAGKEVVQVYVHDCLSELVRPPKELKGFAKVDLEPGETKTVTIALDFRAFAYYHPDEKQWITEDGDFEILIGASAADIRGAAVVTLQSTVQRPCALNGESTVREWLEDPRGRQLFEPLFQQLSEQMQTTFGGDESVTGGMGMDAVGFMMDTPLLDVLQMQEGSLSMPPEAVMDGLLQQAHAAA